MPPPLTSPGGPAPSPAPGAGRAAPPPDPTPPAASPPRSLVRRYLALSLTVTIVVTVLISVAAQWQISSDLNRKARSLAEQAARFLWDQIKEHWLEAADGFVAPGNVDVGENPLGYVITRFRADNNIAVASLIMDDGRVLYSTHGGWSGREIHKPRDWAGILAGETSCELVEPGAEDSVGGRLEESFFRSFVAVGEFTPPGGERTRAVIELYQQAGPMMDELARTRRWVLGAALSCFAAMFLTHFWLFVQGQRTIVARTRALEELSASLEAQVRERTLELATSRRLADVGRLSAGVAHEINTPLASIATCAEGLLQRTDEPEARRYLEIVRKEAFRVKAITRTLLDFSRTKVEGDDPARRRRIPVRQALQEVVDLLSFSLRDRSIRIEVEVQPDDLAVMVEPTALHQIALNLTTNAMDAVSRGGLVRWEAQARDDSVRLRCTDDGAGIPADLLHQVMDPFVTTKAEGHGTGLGLSLAWSLARRQGGTLTIDSPGPGLGCTATLLLQRAV